METVGAAVLAIDDPRGTVEYQEVGQGVPVVFVPGSFSTGASWRGVAAALAGSHRTVSTSLCGYGKTQERRRPTGVNIDDEMDVLEAVLARVGVPAHVVAHSFGAYVALYLALRRAPRLLSLTLLEPTLFNLLDGPDDAALKREVDGMTASYFADWRSGDARAVGRVIDFYGGAGCFDTYPAPLQAKVAASTSTNVLDWQTPYDSAFSARDLASLAVPTSVVCGQTSHAAMRRCNQLLVEHLPGAHLHMLAGANHFMIVTHPGEVARLVQAHIQAVDAQWLKAADRP